MANELATQTNINMDDLKALVVSSNQIQPTDAEMYVFKRLCESLNANPFLRDIYLIKYTKDSPASYITGKDYFNKIARAQGATWEAGILVKRDGAVVEQVGSFSLDTDELVGGWARVHTKDGVIPHSVKLSEYDSKKSSWIKIPNTMIRKVALAQTLREAYPDKFAGVYDSAEFQSVSDEKGGTVDMVAMTDDSLTASGTVHDVPSKEELITSPLVSYAQEQGATVIESKPKITTAPVLTGSVPIEGLEIPPDTIFCPLHNEDIPLREGKYGQFYSHNVDNNWCNCNIDTPNKNYIAAWIGKIVNVHGDDVANQVHQEAQETKANLMWWLNKLNSLAEQQWCEASNCESLAEVNVQGVWTCIEHEDMFASE